MIDDLADATWNRELNDLFLRIGHRFGRADLRRRMRDYVRVLLGPVGRKNGWQLAEHAGHLVLVYAPVDGTDGSSYKSGSSPVGALRSL